MSLKEKLIQHLRDNTDFPEDLFSYLPSGFQELAHRAILNLNPLLDQYATLIGLSIGQIVPKIIAVWNRSGTIQGPFREPTGMTLLWGDPSTEIIHKENGIQYKFDFTKIMFAKGNITERGNLPKEIESGEIIVDMFAGIGYFTLGIAKTQKPEHIYAIEWNPTSFHYLEENLRLNNVESIVTPIFGDCKIEVPNLAAENIRADRIIMGLLPAPTDAIPAALSIAKTSGSIILYEGVEPKESDQLFNEFSKIANDCGFTTQLKERRIVKSYAPKLFHSVVEIYTQKAE